MNPIDVAKVIADADASKITNAVAAATDAACLDLPDPLEFTGAVAAE